jgi:CheY-like chemotaxis protein
MPICVVSTDDSRERALKAGAIAFIAKPLQSKDAVDAAIGELYRYCETSLAQPRRGAAADTAAQPAARRARRRGARRRRRRRRRHPRCPGERDCLVLDRSIADFGRRTSPTRWSDGRGLPAAGGPARPAAMNGADGWQQSAPGVRGAPLGDAAGMLAHASYLLHRSPAVIVRAGARGDRGDSARQRRAAGKKALIVDDDMRNIFALATVLDDEGMEIVLGENGREAIRLVQSDRGSTSC